MKSGSTKNTTKVARLRCKRGLTHAAFADGVGVNIRTVQKLESGEQDIMSVSLGLGLRIADFLGVPPRELV